MNILERSITHPVVGLRILEAQNRRQVAGSDGTFTTGSEELADVKDGRSAVAGGSQIGLVSSGIDRGRLARIPSPARHAPQTVS